MAWAWHGKCETQSNMAALCKSNGKIQSKPLAARHDRETAWARHGTAWALHAMYELAFSRPTDTMHSIYEQLYSPEASFLRSQTCDSATCRESGATNWTQNKTTFAAQLAVRADVTICTGRKSCISTCVCKSSVTTHLAILSAEFLIGTEPKSTCLQTSTICSCTKSRNRRWRSC